MSVVQKKKFDAAAYKRAYYFANKDRILKRQAQLRAERTEEVSAYNAAWRAANRPKRLAALAAWRKANPGYSTAWARKNPAKARLHASARKARKNTATPAWANEFFISEIYDLAERRTKATGIEWHVDHIVPLKSKFVCGLHVEHNLRVIPALENLQKGNRTWPDMPVAVAI